ncbi:hydrogenase maturation protease [Congregibacter variabilis]|uniref:Hydrogenase maturation protease n=1 Tax=Congregibacter variabilis TaxID=3081200 RepID=A0ABZ0I3E5_9GAMM|nr:hydrogenase maturation protease [Congregibacter sp. IMCC43200]
MSELLAVGNPDRGDDGVGPYVVAGLAGRLPKSKLLYSDGEVSDLIAIFARCSQLVLIDALDGPAAGMAPGQKLCLDANDPALAQAPLHASTHALGVVEAISLARSLEVLPKKLTVIAIAGESFVLGEGLSEAVACAADALIEELAAAFIEDAVHA